MPQFNWSGKTPDGHSVSGTMESTSKEAAVSALRGKNIAVSSILERADGLNFQWGRIFLGLLLLAGGALMGVVAKGTRVECARAGAGYDCKIMTTMAGFHVLESESV